MITVALLSGWMLISAYDENSTNIGTIWGPALPPNATDFSGMTNEYVGACIQSSQSIPYFGLPCKCQQVFMSNTQSQMTCLVSSINSAGTTYTQVCTAIHSVTMRL